MKSMTGYGWSEFLNEKISMVTEIKSYNNKYLDININVPSFLSPLDPELRKFLKSRVIRGKVELTLRIKELEDDLEVVVDLKAVEAYKEALSRIAEAAGVDAKPDIAPFLELDGVLKTLKKRDIEEYREIIFPELEKTFIRYEEGRTVEGKETEKDIFSNIEILTSVLDLVRGKEKELETLFKTTIITRYRELMDGELEESRILSETALLLMKYGIGEEIHRLESHLLQFRKMAAHGGAVGKKLDFLCQEINREINTIGSKSTLLEINQAVVQGKDALEKIREQLRNVE